MEYHYLGNSGLKVSAVCFGVMNFNDGKASEVGSITADQAEKLTHTALDLGINFFDTADVYASGISETLLGRALGSSRKDAVIGTKVRFACGTGPNDTGLSRHHIIESCHASLKRLGTDYIDLYQIHSYDPGTPLEETLRALDDLVCDGKIRYTGCSNLAAWQMMKALALADKLSLERFVTSQLYYSPGMRDIEHELVPLCLDQKIGILCWSPLSGGFFTGKYRRNAMTPENARRSRRDAKSMQYWTLDEERGFNVLDALEKAGSAHGKTIAQTALRWLLQRPAVTSVITGATGISQLVENAGATGWSLTAEEMDNIATAGQPAIPYPQSHQLTSDPR